MSRIQKISRSAAAFGALVFALALALAFSFGANGNAHADVKPVGTIGGMQGVSSNPTYDGTPQQGYEGTPYCTYQDGTGNDQTYTGPFIVTYTGTVHEGTADEHPYDATSTPPTQAGSYRVELSLPDSAPCTAAPSGRSFLIKRAPLSAIVSPDDENATRPYDLWQTSTFTDIKLTAFTGLAPADEGKVDITVTGDAMKQDELTGALIPDANVATEDGTPTGKPTGKPFRATSVAYNNPTSYNYDLQKSPDEYNVSGEVTIVKQPMRDTEDIQKNQLKNEYNASMSIPIAINIPTGSTSASYEIITDIEKETQGLDRVSIDQNSGYLTVYANGKGDDANDAVTVRLSALENHEDFNATVHVTYSRVEATIEGVTKLPSPVVYDGNPQVGFEGTPTAFYIDGPTGNRVDYGASPDETFTTSYTGTAADGTTYRSTTPPTNAGTYQVTISISPHHVCMGSKELDFTIVKAPAFATVHTNAQLQPSGVATVDLASVLPGDVGSGPVYTVKSSTTEGLAGVSVDDASGMLTLTAKADALESAIDTVAVKLSDMGNYENSAIEVTVRYERADGVVTGPAAATGLVYNGNPQAGYTGVPSAVYTPAGTTDPLSYNGPFDITYSGTTADGTAYGPTDQAPTAAGAYRVKFAVPGSTPFVATPITLDFSIGKAPLTFRAEDASMTVGDAMPKLGYEVSGLKGSDRVTQEPLLTVEGDTTSAGTYTIAISGAVVDNQSNYDVSYANGTLTVSAVPQPEPNPEPKPESQPQPQPEPAPEPKPEPASEAKTLASTGDSVSPELLVCAAGAAALAIGIAAARRRRTKRD